MANTGSMQVAGGEDINRYIDSHTRAGGEGVVMKVVVILGDNEFW